MEMKHRFQLVVLFWAVAACDARTPTRITPAPVAVSPEPTSLPRVTTPEDAVRVVETTSTFGRPAMFPSSAGSQPCEIRGGGPAPGMIVPGTCRTEIEVSGSTFVVRFVELWDGARFHLAGEATGGELQHIWSFTVTATGALIDESQGGNFPPQLVR
jgi:hypothetical protein